MKYAMLIILVFIVAQAIITTPHSRCIGTPDNDLECEE